MRCPCCSLCHGKYDEGEHTPLLLHCGHGFCRSCLSRMFSTSADTTLTCPRCRYPTVVGNSVLALRKNYPLLSLLSPSPSSPSFDSEDDEDDDKDDEGRHWGEEAESEFDLFGGRRRRKGRIPAKCNGLGTIRDLGGVAIDLGVHHNIKLVRKIAQGRRPGVEVWTATLHGSSSTSSASSLSPSPSCRHRVAVKKVEIAENMDVSWVQNKLDSLRLSSMWCRNVCAFHGVVRMDTSLCLIMDRYSGSIRSEMLKNKGRLTLEQILRYGADIARGIAELHAAGIVCMNLKPSDILLDERGFAVVSDYGLPEILKKSCYKMKTLSEDNSSRIHSCMECTMLDPHYTAPEAWEPVRKLSLFWEDGIGMSKESDAWSFGCTLIEMCTGSMPWSGLSNDEIYRAVVKMRKLPPQYTSVVGVGIPIELWKMIGECLQFKASKRPTFSAMLSIFLRHLQEIPRSPPGSPENELNKAFLTSAPEPSPTSVLAVYQHNPSTLHQLISDGNLNGVKDLLREVSLESGESSLCSILADQNADGQTALHLACRRGHVDIVKTILEYKEADVDILDKDGDPPIIFALTAGSPDCVVALLCRSAKVNMRLREGLGPSIAHICAVHGHPECMRELLQGGADPNAVDDEGDSVLHKAIAKGYSDCAIVVLENGGCKSMGVLNSQKKTPLHSCVEMWNVSVVRRWVEIASEEEISYAIDIPSPNGTALCMAAALKKEHEIEARELVQLLLKAGADPTAQDELHYRTPLHTAAMVNDAELVKLLLDSGVDVNIANLQNTTPLHVALNRGSNSCVRLLLSAGADCNFQDDDGDTAFHIAADAAKMIRENLEWIALMLQSPDAAVDLRNHRGMTLRDFLESLPREWISEDLMEALTDKGVHLSPTIYEVGDWVKFKRSISTPTYGWQGADHRSLGFVQSVVDDDRLIVSFCTGETNVMVNDVIKVIPLNRGQHVRLRRDVQKPRFGWRGQSHDSIGTVLCVDEDGIIRVGFPGASRGWRADPAEMERVEEFAVGDWVRIRPSLTTAVHGLGSVTPGSIGIVYCIRPDSSLLLSLSYLQSPWHCEPEEVEPVEPFRIGEQVCVKRSVGEPRFGWGGETHHSVGRIIDVESDGLLMVEIPNRSAPWQADPSDMEKVENFKVGDWVKVKASVSAPKYGWEDVTRNSIGIIHCLEDDGDMGVAFCFTSKLFCCSVADMEKVQPFSVGQEIHVNPSILMPRLGWSNETAASVGRISRIDMDGTLNVRVSGRATLWKVSPGDAECLPGFEVGDWVRLKQSQAARPSYDWNGIGKESIAVVHSVQDSGYLELAGCFRKGRWIIHFMDVERIPSLRPGQYVHFRRELTEPRWGWRGTSPDSRGVIAAVHADGEVMVAFPGLPGLWRGDPADLERELLFEVGEWVRLKDDGWKTLKPGSVGIVQSLGYGGGSWDGTVQVAFCGEQEWWSGNPSQLEMAEKLVMGTRVRIKAGVKQPRFGWSGHNHGSIGTISSIDGDAKLRVCMPSGGKVWLMDPIEVDKVEEMPISIGNWVKVKGSVTVPAYQWGEVSHSSVGVVHKMEEGKLWVAFCFLEKLWVGRQEEVERVRAFRVGDRVKIKPGLANPRWGWGMETHASQGEVVGVDANGKLRIRFRWRDGQVWIGDPADIVLDYTYNEGC
ncbi:protein kinase KEG [Wolffia australiana]